MIEDLKKGLEKKYNGIRYSNLLKDKEWWFTISPKSFRSILYLMLIDKGHGNIRILKINSEEQLLGILPRKEGVYLSGQYDLYFFIDNHEVLNVRYLTDKGYIERNVSSNVLESIEISDYVFIRTTGDLIDNLLTMEAYLGGDFSEKEKKFSLSLIQKGNNFVAYKVQNEWHFAPSRFVGYKDNNIHKYPNTENRTISSIDKIAKCKLCFDLKLEEAYKEYCELLSIEPSQSKRQYWHFDFTGTSFEELANKNGKEYCEGRILERKHKRKERNRKLVEDAKNKFKSEHEGQVFCEICGFNFMDIYGVDYIELHHLKAIKDMEEDEATRLDDICLVCPNCHRVIHRKYPYLDIKEVFELINRNK